MENLATIIRICPIIQLVLRASGARSRAEDRGREPRNGTDDKRGRKEGRQRERETAADTTAAAAAESHVIIHLSADHWASRAEATFLV